LRLPVQENPSKQIFLTKSGKKKGIFLYPKIVYGIWAISIDTSAKPIDTILIYERIQAIAQK
jgi:hypothetical protein